MLHKSLNSLILPWLILLLTTHFLYSQNKKEIKLEIEKINSELKEIREKYEKEKQFFNRYKSQKEKLIAQKRIEKKEVDGEIKKLNQDLNKIKYQNVRLEKLIAESEETDKEYSALLIEVIGTMREKIISGAPFEKERRASGLTSIILDFKNTSISSLEILNRLVAFFDTEDIYSYDSQVFPNIIKVKGKSYDANILRIGRVFFAADINREIYLYRYKNGKYILDEEPVSTKKKLAIQKAIRIIQGKKAPELVDIPFSPEDLFMPKVKTEEKKIKQ